MNVDASKFTAIRSRPSARHAVEAVLAGPWDIGEFALVKKGISSSSEWLTVPTFKDAVALIADRQTPPELVLLAQPRPGCDEQALVERLRRIAPLTRVIVVAGSWCEGELRTGRPLVGVARLYWYELPVWWRAAIAQLVAGQRPPWADPLDDVRAGRLSRVSIPPGSSRLVIDATDFATFETIAAALTPLGWRPAWHPRHRPKLAEQMPGAESRALAGLWDGGQLEPAELQSLRQFCHQMNCHNSPVIALLDFPRAEHVAHAKAAGTSAILAKPYQITHLADELIRLSA